MSALTTLQREFQAFLRGQGNQLAAQIVDTGRVSASERLGIYARAYHLRLTEALATDFKALHALLGPEAFDKMSQEYIRRHPSHHPSIRWFGKHLAEFLKDTSPYSTQPQLTEMAAFEWALSLSFDAANDDTVKLDDIAAIPADAWPGMRLKLHSSVQRLNLCWNIPPLWRAIDAGTDRDPASRAEWPISWLIWRKERISHFRSLDVDEAWSIDAASEGSDFAALCEGLCEWMDAQNVAMHAASFLKRWVVDGLVARIEYD